MDPVRRRAVLEGYDRLRPFSAGAERVLEALVTKWLIGELDRWWWLKSPDSPFHEDQSGLSSFVGDECERFLSERPILFEPSPLDWYRGRLGL